MKNLLKDTELTKAQVKDIAVEAYIYFYPLRRIGRILYYISIKIGD